MTRNGRLLLVVGKRALEDATRRANNVMASQRGKRAERGITAYIDWNIDGFDGFSIKVAEFEDFTSEKAFVPSASIPYLALPHSLTHATSLPSSHGVS